MKSSHRRRHWLLFFTLFSVGTYLRAFGFFLPSHIGDPTATQSLAMKMNYGFMQHYDVYHYQIIFHPDTGLVDYVWENDPKKWNSRRIRREFHLPLHLQPPLYPILTWLSHGIFNRGASYASVYKNEGKTVILQHPSWRYFKAQFYVVIIPVASSLATLLAVYLFCLRYYSYREGLLSVVLLLASPVDLALSSRPFADALVTAFGFLSVWAYLQSLHSKTSRPLSWAAISGTLLALAYLTKFSGILAAIGMIFATWAFPLPRRKLPWILDGRLWLAGLVFCLAVLPWQLLVWKHYGSLLPPTPVNLNSPWHAFVFSRPWYAYFFGMLYFLPPASGGWLYGFYVLLRPRRYFLEATLFVTAAVLLGALALLLLQRSAGMEHRYLLPAYPFIAILSGRIVVKVTALLRRSWLAQLSYGLSLGLFVWTAWRGWEMGWNALFRTTTVFRPFGW